MFQKLSNKHFEMIYRNRFCLKKIILVIVMFLILINCSKENNKIIGFTTTFGNALHGGITMYLDVNSKFLILKRIGTKRVALMPPPPPTKNLYTEKPKDSIENEEKQYYLDYAKPTTAIYKLTNEELTKLVELINLIPAKEKQDFIPKHPMNDGFSYNFQIIYSDGKIDDVEIEHVNFTSHEKVISLMLSYANKYEKNKNNIHVLKNFEDWNHPKY